MARTSKKEKTAKALTPEEKLAAALVPVEEQPYPVPENWCWTKMSFIAQWGSGGTPSRKNPSYYEGNIPWIKTGELNDGYIYETEEHITEDAIANSSAKLFPINTVAIAMYGATIGKVGILGIEATTNQACACAVCTPILLYKYLFYYACSQKDAFIRKGKGGAQPNISQDIIKNHYIPLSPLTEQQRIVDRIESLFAKLDEAREKAQAVVDSFEDRKAAFLHKTLSGRLTSCTSEIKTVYITDIVKAEKNSLKAGPFGSALTKDMYVSSGYKIYGQEQVINGNESIGDYYINEQKYLELFACKVSPGDVLISLVGTVGKVLVLSNNCAPGIINPRLIKVSLDERIMLPMFFKYYFESGYLRSLYKKDAHGTTMDVLNMGILKKLPFPLISIESQSIIVKILDNFLSKEQKAKEIAEQALTQIEIMKKSILARAFRGELGTNDPIDESAEELLKRIL